MTEDRKPVLYTYEVDECIQQIGHKDDKKVDSTIPNEEVEGSVMKLVVNRQRN